MTSAVMDPAVPGTDATLTSLPRPAAEGASRVSGVHRAIDRLNVAGLTEGEHETVLKDLERVESIGLVYDDLG